MSLAILVSGIIVTVVLGLNNGLALVPPMSYSVWFDGSATSSSGCMNDTMLRATADAMVANGLQAAGYDTFGIGTSRGGGFVTPPLADVELPCQTPCHASPRLLLDGGTGLEWHLDP